MAERQTDILLDSSVLVAWVLPGEPWRGPALAVRQALIDGAVEAAISEHARFEMRHALVRAVRRGRILWRDVLPLIRAVDRIELRRLSLSSDDQSVLQLCHRFGLSWSDANHVRIAVDRGLPLITTDGRLARSVPPSIATIDFLGDRPTD